MRRIRRAHQRHAREQAKRRKKFKQRAVAAGTVAAITLGAGVGLNKAFAHTPDYHELPVALDADADLLADAEEFAIGYRIFKADQNRNEIPDGVELAKRCAVVIEQLPWEDEAGPNETYKWWAPQYGLETCDICGATIAMGPGGVVNPRLGISVQFPFLMAIHYMEHGSFSYAAHYGDDPLQGRLDVPLLMRALGLRFPCDPNEHQLPLDYVVESVGQLAPDANDLDSDLLADSEELKAGSNLHDPDQNQNLTPDGIELAKQCKVAIDQLPEFQFSAPPGMKEPHKIRYLTDGVETCEICGFTICMDHWDIVNPRLDLTISVPVMAAHYMEHGSFSYFGHSPDPPYNPVHAGRVNTSLLLKILEMPQCCGDLGTIYLPSDLNEDCKVDFADFAEFADKWLDSTEPGQDEDGE